MSTNAPQTESPPALPSAWRTAFLVAVVFVAFWLQLLDQSDVRLARKLQIAAVFIPLSGVVTYGLQRFRRVRLPWYAEGLAIPFVAAGLGLAFVLVLRFWMRQL